MNILKKIQTNKRKVLLVVTTLLLLLFVFVSAFPVVQFFYLQGRIPPWPIRYSNVPPEDYPLEPIKQAACFLLGKSNSERRRIIDIYDKYGHRIISPAPHRLYLLMRVLFEIPQQYPVEDAQIFAAYVHEGNLYPPDHKIETVNLLWPLAYEGEDLVLTVQGVGYLGGPYSGISEYDYFLARFPFRSPDELGCE